MTGAKKLEAPHRRRVESRQAEDIGALRLGLRRVTSRFGGRFVERFTVAIYALAVWIVAHVPAGLARWVIGTASQVGYVGWSTKRTWSNRNFGRVLGKDPDDPAVRRLALRAYREYATYLVEIMRLESLPIEQAIAKVAQNDLDRIQEVWQSSPGGLIFALQHVGNTDAVAAGVADRGWPIAVVADDSSFPEMFARFRRLREAWGVQVIPWRNLREIFSVLKNRGMLGLLIDWGYRPDGIPVRLFGAWTTLPAGPATLAAKTGSVILPVAIRRGPDETFHVSFSEVITVPSASDADIARATQQVADALEATIAAAPEQWYSFKPMWPATDEEAAELEARAARMLASPTRKPVAEVPLEPADLLATIDSAPGAGDPATIAAPDPNDPGSGATT
jgi:lauroyl/myristoyl acyltransferase